MAAFSALALKLRRAKPMYRGTRHATGIGPVLPEHVHAKRDNRPSPAPGGEDGYALTELLVVAALLVIVLGAMLTLGETSQRLAPKETERAMVIREAQVGMHRMTRELREAHKVVTPVAGASGPVVDVWVPTGITEKRVSYECGTQCIRYDVSVAGVKSNAQVVVDGVLNGGAGSALPVFVRGEIPTSDYVKTTVEVAARGELQNGYPHKILLEDGFYMRNLGG
jgi:type II secretory pathway pseudopilin PulG